MPVALTIGDFARATPVGVKTLRHYHCVGLLVPAASSSNVGWPATEASLGDSASMSGGWPSVSPAGEFTTVGQL